MLFLYLHFQATTHHINKANKFKDTKSGPRLILANAKTMSIIIFTVRFYFIIMNHDTFVYQRQPFQARKQTHKQIRTILCFYSFSLSHEICSSNINTSVYGSPIHKIGKNRKSLAAVRTMF